MLVPSDGNALATEQSNEEYDWYHGPVVLERRKVGQTSPKGAGCSLGNQKRPKVTPKGTSRVKMRNSVFVFY